MMVMIALWIKSPKAIMPLREGKVLAYMGTYIGDSTVEKSTLKPQETPRKMTTPMRKKTFRVPTELNLVKKVGDLRLITGSMATRKSGAVFLVKIVLAGAGSSWTKSRS